MWWQCQDSNFKYEYFSPSWSKLSLPLLSKNGELGRLALNSHLVRFPEELLSQIAVPLSAGSGPPSKFSLTLFLERFNLLASLLKQDAQAQERPGSLQGPDRLLECMLSSKKLGILLRAWGSHLRNENIARNSLPPTSPAIGALSWITPGWVLARYAESTW